MEKEIKNILEILKKRGWYIGTMESCTGGAVANSITNIPGASDVFKEGLITYSNESKIKAGVDKKIIEKYGVFSMEVAQEMAKKIGGDPPTASQSGWASIGIGITGNLPGMVYVAVRIDKKVESEKFKVENLLKDKIKARKEMKREVVEMVWKMVTKELNN